MKFQNKTTLRFHFIPIRMSKTNKTNDSSCCWRCGERETLVVAAESEKLLEPCANLCGGSLKAESRSTTRSRYTTLGQISKGLYILLQRYCLILVYIVLNSWRLETAWRPSNSQKDNEDIQVNIIQLLRKMKFAGKWMKLEVIILSEVTKIQITNYVSSYKRYTHVNISF